MGLRTKILVSINEYLERFEKSPTTVLQKVTALENELGKDIFNETAKTKDDSVIAFEDLNGVIDKEEDLIELMGLENISIQDLNNMFQDVAHSDLKKLDLAHEQGYKNLILSALEQTKKAEKELRKIEKFADEKIKRGGPEKNKWVAIKEAISSQDVDSLRDKIKQGNEAYARAGKELASLDDDSRDFLKEVEKLEIKKSENFVKKHINNYKLFFEERVNVGVHAYEFKRHRDSLNITRSKERELEKLDLVIKRKHKRLETSLGLKATFKHMFSNSFKNAVLRGLAGVTEKMGSKEIAEQIRAQMKTRDQVLDQEWKRALTEDEKTKSSIKDLLNKREKLSKEIMDLKQDEKLNEIKSFKEGSFDYNYSRMRQENPKVYKKLKNFAVKQEVSTAIQRFSDADGLNFVSTKKKRDMFFESLGLNKMHLNPSVKNLNKLSISPDVVKALAYAIDTMPKEVIDINRSKDPEKYKNFAKEEHLSASDLLKNLTPEVLKDANPDLLIVYSEAIKNDIDFDLKYTDKNGIEQTRNIREINIKDFNEMSKYMNTLAYDPSINLREKEPFAGLFKKLDDKNKDEHALDNKKAREYYDKFKDKIDFYNNEINEERNQFPIDPEQAPKEPEQAPVDPEQAPVDPEQAPVEPEQAPVDPEPNFDDPEPNFDDPDPDFDDPDFDDI